MKLKRRAIVGSFLLLSCCVALSQYQSSRLLNVASGLPSNEAYALHVDRHGYTWIATQDGLCRYDGRSVTPFLPNQRDSTSILNLRCYSIMEASNGTLHFASVNGISTFDPGRQAFTNITPGGSRMAEPFRGTANMYLVNDTTFAFMRLGGTSTTENGSNHSLHIASFRTGRSHAARLRLPNGSVVTIPFTNALVSGPGGSLVLATQYGLAWQSPHDTVFTLKPVSGLPLPLPSNALLIRGTATTAWLLYGTNVAVVDVKKQSIVATATAPLRGDDGFSQAACRVGERTLAIVSNQGASIVDYHERTGIRVHRVGPTGPTAVGLLADYSYDMVIADSVGNVTFAGSGGVHCINVASRSYQFVPVALNATPLPYGTAVLPIHRDAQGRVRAWIRNMGLVVVDPTAPTFATVTDLPFVSSATLIDERTAMLFSWTGWADVTIYDIASGQRRMFTFGADRLVPTQQPPANPRPNGAAAGCAMRARDGSVWVGCIGAIRKIRLPDLSMQTYSVDGSSVSNVFESNVVSRIFQLADGRIWALTDHGRYEYDAANDRFVFRAPTSKFSDFALADALVGAAAGLDGTQWLYGFREIGILQTNGAVAPVSFSPADMYTEPLAAIKCWWVLDSKTAYGVDRRSVVVFDLVNKTYKRIRSPFVPEGREPYVAAAVDHRGVMWAATATHCESFEPRSGRFRLVPLSNHAAGVQIQAAMFPRVGNLIHIALRDADGGLLYINPHVIRGVRKDVAIHHNALLVGDSLRPLPRWLNLYDTISVHYSESPFTIRFDVVDPTYGSFVKCRYLLEGFDERWVMASDVFEARYQHVDPGTYRFRVQVFDVDGRWKEPRQPMVVEVRPAWWQTIWLKLSSGLMIVLAGIGVVRSRLRTITERNRQLEVLVEERTQDLRIEQQRSDSLLLNVLPASIAERLKRGEKHVADSYTEASVLFADLVGFTPLTSSLTPHEVVAMLNGLFTRFDRAARERGVERIKTIGDGYMAAAGIPDAAADHAQRLALFAVDMIGIIHNYASETGYDLHLRVGIHSGEVVAAIVGETRFAYDVWGDAVNVAARMEGLSESDRIHCSQAFVDALGDTSALPLRVVENGETNVKGKGVMYTYWIEAAS